MKSGKPLIFSWSMMPSVLGIEVLARGGFEACCIDLQHGYVGYSDFLAMSGAVFAARKPLVVRIPLEDWGMAARALDAGASSVICPMVNNAEDAAKLSEVTKFPPIGARSFGAYRDASTDGPRDRNFLETINHSKLSIAMIETRQALDNLDAICATPGIDGAFVGPFDLSVSLSGGSSNINPAGAEVLEALDEIAAACRRHSLTAGIYAASPQDARVYIEKGFQLIALSNDISMLSSASSEAFNAV
ncbi:MAG: HpcH/HpaI aldolase family protein [Hyphomicrobiales bacterium]